MFFFAIGNGPAVRLVAPVLTAGGFKRTTNEHEATFLVAEDSRAACRTPDKPCIILSSGDVYASLSAAGDIDPAPFSEDAALVVPSTRTGLRQAMAIQDEAIQRFMYRDHAVLRLFDVYGTGQGRSVVDRFLKNARDGVQATVTLSPHRKISCLHMADFSAVLIAFVRVFLEKGVRGVYNLGSPQAVTMNHVAETVSQLLKVPVQKLLISATTQEYVNWYHVPDILRISAITGVSPGISLRKGVWQVLSNGT